MKIGIEVERLVDESPGFIHAALVEQDERQVGIRNRVLGIELDGAPESRFCLQKSLEVGVEQAELVPDLGIARCGFQGLFQVGERRLAVAVDVGLDPAAHGQNKVVVRIRRPHALQRGAHLISAIEGQGEL